MKKTENLKPVKGLTMWYHLMNRSQKIGNWSKSSNLVTGYQSETEIMITRANR